MKATEKILNLIKSKIELLNLYRSESESDGFKRKLSETRGMVIALNTISEIIYHIEYNDADMLEIGYYTSNGEYKAA